MKYLTVAVTALGLFAFAGAASAMCSGFAKPATDQTAETIIPEPKTAGS
jgi:hypothetical protein